MYETFHDTPVTDAVTIPPVQYETSFECFFSNILGIAFVMTMLVPMIRMFQSYSDGGPEDIVVTYFYSLILITSGLRAIWFLIPDKALGVSYTPSAVMAFSKTNEWVSTFILDLLHSLGSISLFSIFILILVYWADILKKYFEPGSTHNKPMRTFVKLVAMLLIVEALNCLGFLLRFYSSECLILVNAILLAVVSIICVYRITVFSHNFRTVLKTLGAINQVSTESQVQRIVWITVTGNIFFLLRAFMETIFAGALVKYWISMFHFYVSLICLHITLRFVKTTMYPLKFQKMGMLLMYFKMTSGMIMF